MATLPFWFRVKQVFRPTIFDPADFVGQQAEEVAGMQDQISFLMDNLSRERTEIARLEQEKKNQATELEAKASQITIHERTISALAEVIERDRMRVKAETAEYAATVARIEAGRINGG